MRHHVTDPHAAPGWYPDAGHTERLRWWDGARWSDLVRPAPPRPPRRHGAAVDRRGRRLWLRALPLVLLGGLWMAAVSRLY